MSKLPNSNLDEQVISTLRDRGAMKKKRNFTLPKRDIRGRFVTTLMNPTNYLKPVSMSPKGSRPTQ